MSTSFTTVDCLRMHFGVGRDQHGVQIYTAREELAGPSMVDQGRGLDLHWRTHALAMQLMTAKPCSSQDLEEFVADQVRRDYTQLDTIELICKSILRSSSWRVSDAPVGKVMSQLHSVVNAIEGFRQKVRQVRHSDVDEVGQYIYQPRMEELQVAQLHYIMKLAKVKASDLALVTPGLQNKLMVNYRQETLEFEARRAAEEERRRMVKVALTDEEKAARVASV